MRVTCSHVLFRKWITIRSPREAFRCLHSWLFSRLQPTGAVPNFPRVVGGGFWGELTAWSRDTATLIVRQLVGKSPALQIYTATEAGNDATHTFITIFTTAHLLSLFWARCIQSTPSHSISCRSTLLILPSMLWPWKCFLSFRFPFVIHRSYMPIFRQVICIN